MLFLVLLIAGIIVGFCLTEGNSRKTFAGIVMALLYFPIGVIFALAKKYK